MSVLGRAFPVVLAAPSGAGKTTLAKALVERNRGVVFSVSATTRAPRLHERPDVDYLFLDDAEFDRLRDTGALVEWAVVHRRRYGTPRKGIEQALARGEIVVLDIDFQGARQMRAAFPETVLVFVLPPSTDELIRRLLSRASENAHEQQDRLRTARVELGVAHEFDYVVINDDFESAIHALECILEAERHRVSRTEGIQERLLELNQRLNEVLKGAVG